MAFTPRTETYVNVSSLTTPFNITVTKPTGTVDGDILFCWIGWYAAVTIDSVPANWNLLGEYLVNTDRYALYYKVASGEGASWVWSFTATAKVRAVCSCYTSGDFNPTSPIDVVSNTAYRTSDNQCVAATMNVAKANSPLIFWGGCYSTAAKTYTKPTVPTTGWVEDDDAGNTTPDFWTEVCSFIWGDSGLTGAMAATISATLTAKHAFAVALKPDDNYSGTAAVTGIGTSAEAGRKGGKGTVDAVIGASSTSGAGKKAGLGLADTVAGIGTTAATGEAGAEAYEGAAAVSAIGQTAETSKKGGITSVVAGAVASEEVAGRKGASSTAAVGSVSSEEVSSRKGAIGSVAVGSIGETTTEGKRGAEGTATVSSVADASGSAAKASAGTVAVISVGGGVATAQKGMLGAALLSCIGASDATAKKGAIIAAVVEALGGSDALAGRGAYGTVDTVGGIGTIVASGTSGEGEEHFGIAAVSGIGHAVASVLSGRLADIIVSGIGITGSGEEPPSGGGVVDPGIMLGKPFGSPLRSVFGGI